MRAFLCMVGVLALTSIVGAQTAIAGHWETDPALKLAQGPYVLEFTGSGSSLAGTIAQTQLKPVPLTDIKLTGTMITFKATAPGGERSVIFTGEVKVRIRGPAELAGVQGGRAGLGPYPRVGLVPGERPVLAQRFGPLTAPVRGIAPALGVGLTAATEQPHRNGDGGSGRQRPRPRHPPVRPSIAR